MTATFARSQKAMAEYLVHGIRCSHLLATVNVASGSNGIAYLPCQPSIRDAATLFHAR